MVTGKSQLIERRLGRPRSGPAEPGSYNLQLHAPLPLRPPRPLVSVGDGAPRPRVNLASPPVFDHADPSSPRGESHCRIVCFVILVNWSLAERHRSVAIPLSSASISPVATPRNQDRRHSRWRSASRLLPVIREPCAFGLREAFRVLSGLKAHDGLVVIDDHSDCVSRCPGRIVSRRYFDAE
jgi:hypothetical protein